MPDFSTCKRKRFVQSLIYSRIMYPNCRVVGLGGPQVSDYLHFIKQFGATSAQIWEVDFKTFSEQERQRDAGLFPIPCELINGNIRDVVLKSKDLPDFDFCSSFKTVRDIIKKFPKALYTFSRRDGKQTIDNCLEGYLDIMGVSRNRYNLKKSITYDTITEYTIVTESQNYTAFTYMNQIPKSNRNGTQMLTIYPIPKNKFGKWY